MPEAPGMFSTTIGWPSVRDAPSATRRAIMSVAAPGPVGTISLIGRLGQVWAFAVAASATTAQHSSARERVLKAFHLVSRSRSGALRRMDSKRAERAVLFSFDAGCADDLRPFLRVVDNELAEISRRARKDLRAHIVEPDLYLGSASPALIAPLSLSMMSAGVPLGAPTPCQ